MYLFVYKTIHENGKFYVGRHQTKILNDEYFGSGKWVKSIKDKKFLKREILQYAENFNQLCEIEQKYIDKYWEDPNCMNYSKSSIGAPSGESNPMFGKTGELNHMFHRRGINHPSFGKKHSKETCMKKSKALKGKSFDDLHGKEKAEQIKLALRKPKTEEQKNKLRKPKELSVCRIFDKKLMPIGNFLNWVGYQEGKISKNNKKYQFLYNGEIIYINHLQKYCILNNLSWYCMRDVYNGKQKTHKGFTKCHQ